MRKPICLLLFPLLALLAAALSACGSEITGKKPTESIPRESIVSVNILSESGDVTVSGGSKKDIVLDVAYEISSPSEERRKLIKDNVLVTNDTSDPSVLTILSRLNESVTLSENESVRIHISVRVPDKIGSIVVQSTKGNVLIQEVKDCQCIVTQREGDVEIRDAALLWISNISCTAGNIKVKLNSISKMDQFTAFTELGDIRFNCPKTSSYTATLTENNQKGFKHVNKSGKSIINLTTKIGTVDFQK